MVDTKTNGFRGFVGNHPIWSIVGVFLLISVFGLISGDGIPPQPPVAQPVAGDATAPVTAQPNVPEPPSMKVTAEELHGAYTANEVSADAKYKGKVVEVSGIIGTIGKDILNNPYVTLKTGGEYSILNVQFVFTKADESQLANLVKGKRITIIGRVSGMSVGNVVVQESRLP